MGQFTWSTFLFKPIWCFNWKQSQTALPCNTTEFLLTVWNSLMSLFFSNIKLSQPSFCWRSIWKNYYYIVRTWRRLLTRTFGIQAYFWLTFLPYRILNMLIKLKEWSVLKREIYLLKILRNFFLKSWFPFTSDLKTEEANVTFNCLQQSKNSPVVPKYILNTKT